MLDSRVNDEYFEWICNKVCEIKTISSGESYDRFAEGISFRRLLRYLHDVEFMWSNPMDGNRAEDGINLRDRFAYEVGYEYYVVDYIEGPCSVLEMMVALAIHTEEDIMVDARFGDRTGQWFWNMVVSLGLGGMYDEHFNERLTEEIITRFLNREYDADGSGGLFTITNCPYDLRDVEIHAQRNWYLNGIV